MMTGGCRLHAGCYLLTGGRLLVAGGYWLLATGSPSWLLAGDWMAGG